MLSVSRSGTAGQILTRLASYRLREVGRGSYRANSPFRPGSDSESFTVTVDDDEHGAYYDHVTGERGSLYELAERLGVARPERQPEPTTKRAYSGLGEYAAAHHTPAAAFRRAMWEETQKDGRPALKFPTNTGDRYRFLDGNKPTYKSPKDYRACWYGLKAAAAMEGPLVICNGEASTIAGQHYGVAACCVTGGEKGSVAPELVAELKSVAAGREVLVAFDSDETGRQAGTALAALLYANGLECRAVDLKLFKGGDLADFCGEHGQLAVAELLRLPAPSSAQQTTAKGRKFFTLPELENMPPVKMLTPIIPERGLVVAYGPSGAGKSFWALDMALELSQVTTVLYVAAEGQYGISDRAKAWQKHHNKAAGQITFALDRVALDQKGDVQAFIAEIARYKPRVVVIDTLARCMAEGDENNTRDMNRVIAGFEVIQQAIEGVVVVVHHTRKGSLVERGSSALRAAADVMVSISKNDDVIEVNVDKVKDSAPPAPSQLRLIPVRLADGKDVPVLVAADKVQVSKDDPLSIHQRAVLSLLALTDDALTVKDMMETANVPGKGIYRVVSALMWRKLIERVGAGSQYRITAEGRAVMAKLESVSMPESVDAIGVVSEYRSVSVQNSSDEGGSTKKFIKTTDTTDTTPTSTRDSRIDTRARLFAPDTDTEEGQLGYIPPTENYYRLGG